jgi:hypothetical protein
MENGTMLDASGWVIETGVLPGSSSFPHHDRQGIP